jgi:hypothetical protein
MRFKIGLLSTAILVSIMCYGCSVSSMPTHLRSDLVIGHGRTLAGTNFIATLEAKGPGPIASRRHSGPSGLDCPLYVVITEVRGLGGGKCLTKSTVKADPSVHCNSGILTVTSQTLATTRSVLLVLSNGERVVSSALIVPARYGGPAGLFHQAIRGPSSFPVSLVELDQHGKKLRLVELPRVTYCRKSPSRYASANTLHERQGKSVIEVGG